MEWILLSHPVSPVRFSASISALVHLAPQLGLLLLSAFSLLAPTVAVALWFRAFLSHAKALCTTVDHLPSPPTHANPILTHYFWCV